MTTPLFPENNGPILIKQGRIGDCYLLASIDCIANSGPKGYQFLQSLFSEVPGGVVVQLKHNQQILRVNSDLLAKKYTYFHDKRRNKDVFFLNQAKLDEIDSSNIGVKSNSLAVKILEHLSSYYFTCDRRSLQRTSSLTAHDLPDRFSEESTVFVAKLLGLYAHNLYNFERVIKIKTICPKQPIYIGMYYGDTHNAGEAHERHALRIQDILPSKDGSDNYEIVLVNPWNNQLTETYSLNDLKKRKCYLALFDVDRPTYELLRMLVSTSATLGHVIFASPERLRMVLQIKKQLGRSFNRQDIEYCDMLYQQSPWTADIFNHLSLDEQRRLTTDIHAVNGEFETPLHFRIMRFFSMHIHFIQKNSFHQWIYLQANIYTDRGLRMIHLFPISFIGMNNHEEIDTRYKHLIKLLSDKVQNSPMLIAAEYLLKTKEIARRHPVILQAFYEKTREIHAIATAHHCQLLQARAAREHYGLFTVNRDSEENHPGLQLANQTMDFT